ncbi:MAG: hypothetical protein ACRDKW_06540, partial [Actinomycetota bacterium]
VLLVPATAYAVLSKSRTVAANTITAATLQPPASTSAVCGLGSVTVSWPAAAHADGYFVYRSQSGGPQNVLLNGGNRVTGTSYVDSGNFSALASYTYKVKSARATNWISSSFSPVSPTRSMTLFLVCL